MPALFGLYLSRRYTMIESDRQGRTMRKGVVIDCCTLGVLANPNSTQDGKDCRAWALELKRKRTLVRISGIAHYESRRKLLQTGSQSGITKLDEMIAIYGLLSVSEAVLRLAAQLWADLKIELGKDGTDNRRLDADVIIGAEAKIFAQEQEVAVTVATDNLIHFQPLVDGKFMVGAAQWQNILP